MPLHVNLEEDDGEKIVWDNEKYSSTRFYRPLPFQFAKETPEKMKATVVSIQTEILNLMPTPITSDITIEHNVILSMINGKVTGVLTGTSNSNCTICLKKPLQMNEESALDYKCDPVKVQYGLSVLHSNIRFFALIGIKKYRITKDEDKKLMNIRKTQIQIDFAKKLVY